MDRRTSPFSSRSNRILAALVSSVRVFFALIVGGVLIVSTQVASAENLVMKPDINNAKPGSKYYVHGLSMAQIVKRFGQPSKKRAPDPRVGTKYQPPITRWDYPGFTVYFEHGIAIHLVKHHQRPK